jgi:anti-anti-sigma regulatory factor
MLGPLVSATVLHAHMLSDDMEAAMRTINGGPGWTEELADHGVRVLAVRGQFTQAVGERMAQRLLGLASAGGRDFVVDLVAVVAMDPQAMIPLLRASRQVRSDGGRISVVFDPLLQVFAVEGLEDLFDVAVTREDAVAGIAQRGSAEACEHLS